MGYLNCKFDQIRFYLSDLVLKKTRTFGYLVLYIKFWTTLTVNLAFLAVLSTEWAISLIISWILVKLLQCNKLIFTWFRVFWKQYRKFWYICRALAVHTKNCYSRIGKKNVAGGLGSLWAPQWVQWGTRGGKGLGKFTKFSLKLAWYSLPEIIKLKVPVHYI